jgi:L-methionine (R)-S-oxide reductase
MLDEQSKAWLSALLTRHGAVAGTLHVVRGDVLAIVAAVNIPAKVQEITATIPLGKGMAGLAWQQDRAIQTCNLKDDASGAVKPGAKAVDARAAVALPVHNVDGTVRAVVGLAWMDERVLGDDTIAAIVRDAEQLA